MEKGLSGVCAGGMVIISSLAIYGLISLPPKIAHEDALLSQLHTNQEFLLPTLCTAKTNLTSDSSASEIEVWLSPFLSYRGEMRGQSCWSSAIPLVISPDNITHFLYPQQPDGIAILNPPGDECVYQWQLLDFFQANLPSIPCYYQFVLTDPPFSSNASANNFDPQIKQSEDKRAELKGNLSLCWMALFFAGLLPGGMACCAGCGAAFSSPL